MPRVAVEHLVPRDIVDINGRLCVVQSSEPRSGCLRGADADYWFLWLDPALPQGTMLPAGMHSASSLRSTGGENFEVLRGVLLDAPTLVRDRVNTRA